MGETYDEQRQFAIEAGIPEQRLDEARANGEKVYENKEVLEDFEIQSFLAPFVAVRRKSDGVEGAMIFTHSPRFYFGFVENGD